MTHGDSLAMTIEATQQSLEERLQEALAPHRDPQRPRDGYAATDTFMAATSRHLSAVQAVLLDPVRKSVPGGDALVHEYLHAAKRLELTLYLVKSRLYGEAHSMKLSWSELWTTVQQELAEHNRLESNLVAELIRHGDAAQVDGLARKVFDAETHAPTRPHPRLPHTGMLALMARRVWSVADRFWDTAEGRVIPEPIHPAHHKHDSLLAQYLVADPMFDDHAHLMERRHRHVTDETAG